MDKQHLLIYIIISILGLTNYPSLANDQTTPSQPNSQPNSQPTIKPEKPKPDLNQELKKALCVQDWKKALQTLDQMVKIAPNYTREINTYRQQIVIIAKSGQIIPNWPSDCNTKKP